MKNQLLSLCDEIFLLITQLKQSSQVSDLTTLRQELTRMLASLESRAREHGIDSADASEVKFALAAFLDEIVLSSQFPGKETWQFNPLAVEHFMLYNAGEEFFTKLTRLRQNSRQKRDILQVYYLCLALGFKGQYGLYGPEKLQALMEDVYHDLKSETGTGTMELSPHWKRTDEFVQHMSDIPVWAIVLSAVGIAILFLLIMKLLIAGKIDSVAEELAWVENFSNCLI